MLQARTPEGRIRLRELATGQIIERWPVDARGMIERGECVPAPLGEASPAPSAPVDPVPHVTAAKAQVEAQAPAGAPLVVDQSNAPREAGPPAVDT